MVIAGWGATPSTFPQVIDSWGRGFWDLIPFTLQRSLIIVTGQVVAMSPPVSRFIHRVADPHSPRAAHRAGHGIRPGELVAELGIQSRVQRPGLSPKVARRDKGVD
jgi:hypothetical protein